MKIKMINNDEKKQGLVVLKVAFLKNCHKSCLSPRSEFFKSKKAILESDFIMSN